MKHNILGIIPARGGSKGIPGKNIFPLKGKPLISYSIEQGLNSKLLTDLIVSTDSEKIKEVSEKYGAKVPFNRPPELSSDSALAIPTIKHAVESYEKIVGYKYDYIIMTNRVVWNEEGVKNPKKAKTCYDTYTGKNILTVSRKNLALSIIRKSND